jgi:hypothetical protein
MAAYSIILGTIDGIQKKDYERLKKELKDCFQHVAWKDDSLIIKSEKQHHRVKIIATKVADCIQDGKFGSLLYIGNDRVVCIYFGHKQFVGKQYGEPEPPEWWGQPKEKPEPDDLADKLLLNIIKD